MKPHANPASLTGALDAAFMARVHKASLFVAGLVTACAAFYRIGGNWSLGFLCAALWSIANLWTLERLVRAALHPGSHDKVAIGVSLLVKLPLLYAALLLLLVAGGFSATALVTGVSVPLVVVLLKIAGRMLALRLRAGGPGIPEPRS
jgi:hypothetical protein